MVRAFLGTLLILAVGACAVTPTADTTAQLRTDLAPVEPDHVRPAQPFHPGAAWGNHGLGGAAYRKPDYVHVVSNAPPPRSPAIGMLRLAPDYPPSLLDSYPAEPPAVVPSAVPSELASVLDRALSFKSPSNGGVRMGGAASAMPPNGQGHGAWTKFCARGAGMTSDEWAFVLNSGGLRGVPSDLAATCASPLY